MIKKEKKMKKILKFYKAPKTSKILEPQILPPFFYIVNSIIYLQETRKQNIDEIMGTKYQILDNLQNYIQYFNSNIEETINIIDTTKSDLKNNIIYDIDKNYWKISKNINLSPIKIVVKKYQEINTYFHLNFPVLSSSNQFLKDNYSFFPTNILISCDLQTNGRGRMNRNWYTEDKKNITMSLLIKNNKPNKISDDKIPNLSLLTGASLLKTINKTLDDNNKNIKCFIKWPNDILINDKKVCGILLESISSKHINDIIIGIGINVNTTFFNDELNNKATSLKQILNKDININNIISSFIHYFDELYNDFIHNGNIYLDIIKQNNYLKGKTVSINNEIGIVIDILDNGNLLIQTKDGNKEIFYGEVTLTNSYIQG